MKGPLAYLVMFLLPVTLGAQEQQTLLSGPMDHGGFGGPVVKFTQVADRFGVFVGGRGGWIINHQLVLGGGGYGLANPNDFVLILDGIEHRLGLGYGGFEVEYVNRWDEVAHLTAGVLIGGGGASWYDWRYQDWGFEDYTDAFFVAEPTLSLELNVVSFFRISLGASYRIVANVDLVGLSDSDLSGGAGSITFKFGSF